MCTEALLVIIQPIPGHQEPGVELNIKAAVVVHLTVVPLQMPRVPLILEVQCR